jgi:hypothetical protein
LVPGQVIDINPRGKPFRVRVDGYNRTTGEADVSWIDDEGEHGITIQLV